ncbi:MAG: ferrous iron transport protein B, partial [Desulfobia sp.]
MTSRQKAPSYQSGHHSAVRTGKSSSIFHLVKLDQAEVKVALAGNPNSGKSTLFNTLTGARQQVGNYPGVTVEKKEGLCRQGDEKIHVVDLPGTYSLTANSLEEVVARDFLVTEEPQVVVNIVDASNLERHLFLTCQFLEMGIPVVLALNMIDVARDRGIEIKAERLSALLGVPVVPIIARSGQGKEELVQKVLEVARGEAGEQETSISYGEDIDAALLKMTEEIETAGFLSDAYQPRWLALKYVEGDRRIIEQGRKISPSLSDRLEKTSAKLAVHLQETEDLPPEAVITDQRYGYIKSVLRQGVVDRKQEVDRLFLSDKIDKVLTNRLFGPVIMLAILFGLYQFTFTYSELPVSWLEGFFGFLGSTAENVLPDGLVKSLVVSGIIDGVGGVLGFVPLLMFMFFGIAILEDTGYLARVAFMLDRLFRMFGLHGNSVMGYIVSGGIAGGCAVPGVMATRTLKSSRERLATLLTVPFMNCGAKLPVLALLIGTFFATQKAWLMFGFTLLAWFVSLLVAKLLRSTILKGEAMP